MDSDNILSILNSLAQGTPQDGAPTNVLQQVAPQAQQAPPPPSAADIAQAATAASPPTPRPRRSLIDTIGRLSDVFAQVGGAAPLYQPTLNSREDRALALGDHARLVDLDALKKKLEEQQVAAGALEPIVAERKRLGIALGGLSGQANAAELWPSIAEQAGIDPQKAAAIGQMLKANPAAAGILAKSLGADTDNLGKNVLFGTTTDGKTVAYQVGPDGHPHILDFGNTGITPSEPIKIVDTGNSQVIVGQSGQPKKILPKFEAPGRAADRNERAREANNTNTTAITIAGMPARAKDGTAASAKAGDANVPTLLTNIEQGFNDLHAMQALPGEGSGVGELEGIVGRSALGQKAGEQLGMPAAQKRLEIMKNVSALQQAMLKSLPASATRTKFEQEMLARGLPDPSKMSLKTAQTVIRQLRKSYAEAVATLNKSAPAPKTVQPTGGWGTATVVHGG
jgi:hypothetical protein